MASGMPCRPCNTSVLFGTLPIFYIAQAPNAAVERRFRLAGACGRIEHVPALMAQKVFAEGTPSPFQFRPERQQLDGSADGYQFAVRRWPFPRQQSLETCASPNLAEMGILLSHLRAMAIAYRYVASVSPASRPRAVLIVEEDVDLRLVPRWLGAPGGGAPSELALGGLDAVFAALPAGWGLVQLALISSGPQFKQQHSRLAAGTRVVPHEQLVNQGDGRNEGWSTAAYAASPLGLRALLDAYWPGGAGGALVRGGPRAAPTGVVELSHKPCLRADWLLYDGRVTAAYVSTQPLFLFGAGSASREKRSEAKRVSGVQLMSLKHILTLFYGFTMEEVRRVIVENAPRGAAPVRKGRQWRERNAGPRFKWLPLPRLQPGLR